jgi:hypothetical protein
MTEATQDFPVQSQEWTERRKLPDGSQAVVKRTDQPAAEAKPKPAGSLRREGGQLVPYGPDNALGGPIARPDPAAVSKPPVVRPDPSRRPTIQELVAELEVSRGVRRPTPRPRPAPSPAELEGRPAAIPDPSCLPGCLPGWYPGKPPARSNREIQADIAAAEKRKTELLQELAGLGPTPK